MITFQEWLAENEIQRYLPTWLPKKISRQEAKKMVGPVYHGSTETNRQLIKYQGFQFFKEPPRQGNVRHGFELKGNYPETDAPPPIHFLGYGVYFSISKGQAAKYNVKKDNFGSGSKTGLIPYYINAPRLEELNLASPKKMMAWWKENGYNMPPIEHLQNQMLSKEEIEELWIKETDNLTKTLSSKWDAVHFIGKGFGSLLDGNQICVYNPENICVIDEKSEPELDAGNGVFIKIGDRVQIKGTTATGIIANMKAADYTDDVWHKIVSNFNYFITLDQSKNIDQIKAVYADKLREALKIDKFNKIRFQNGLEHDPTMTFEKSTESCLNWQFRLPLRLPSSLVGRVLAKDERVGVLRRPR